MKSARVMVSGSSRRIWPRSTASSTVIVTHSLDTLCCGIGRNGTPALAVQPSSTLVTATPTTPEKPRVTPCSAATSDCGAGGAGRVCAAFAVGKGISTL